MQTIIGRFSSFVILAGVIACASGGSPEFRRNRDLITVEELAESQYTNPYDAVQALHPNWMRARGPDSFSNPSRVWVYLDNVKLGDVTMLKSIGIRTVKYIQYLDPPSAQNRFGMGHAAGVILVSTQ